MKRTMWLAALAVLALAAGGCEQKQPAEMAPPQKAAIEEQKAVAEEPKAAVEEPKAVAEEPKAAAPEPKAAVPTAVAKPAAAPSPPKTVTYQASYGQVTFDHQTHAGSLACGSCHDSDPPAKITLGKEKAHQLCKGCHQDKGSGPVQCNGCHKKG